MQLGVVRLQTISVSFMAREVTVLVSWPVNGQETRDSAALARVGPKSREGGLEPRTLAVKLGGLGHVTSKGFPAHLATKKKGLRGAWSPPEPAACLGKGP